MAPSLAIALDPIEQASLKDDEQFTLEYLRPRDGWTEWVHPATKEKYSLSLAQADNVSSQDLKTCLALVEETSRSHYETSSRGWKPRNKLAEMKSPELRYILVRDGAGGIHGFTSLMPTYEEDQPVIYCYEIHLRAEMRGTGLGSLLMDFHDSVARNTSSVTKVMLTCFTKNSSAFQFYRKLGFDVDPISPEPKKLRSGKESVPDYVIMSKTIV